MRKLALLLCMLVVLFASVGAVSADKPELGQITINSEGSAIVGYGTLPNGRMWLHLTATGSAVGAAEGVFDFEEWVVVVAMDPETGEVSGRNNGMVTVFDADSNLLVQLEFNGKFDAEGVWGKWQAKNPDNPSLKGHGDYTGTAAEPYAPFSVTFTGKFKD